jgi:hypothetical protein
MLERHGRNRRSTRPRLAPAAEGLALMLVAVKDSHHQRDLRRALIPRGTRQAAKEIPSFDFQSLENYQKDRACKIAGTSLTSVSPIKGG